MNRLQKRQETYHKISLGQQTDEDRHRPWIPMMAGGGARIPSQPKEQWELSRASPWKDISASWFYHAMIWHGAKVEAAGCDLS